MRFLNPQYTDSYLADFYGRYIPQDGVFGHHDEQRSAAWKRELLATLARHVRPGRLLCVGCGDGLELRIAREAGWRVEGYDVDPQTTRRVANNLGLTVYTGDFTELALPVSSYSGRIGNSWRGEIASNPRSRC